MTAYDKIDEDEESFEKPCFFSANGPAKRKKVNKVKFEKSIQLY